jgi:micrococcal nuclease
VLTILPILLLDASPAAAESRELSVRKITDGDTIVVADAERVRFIGIDATETRGPGAPQCFSREAARYVRKTLPVGTAVRLESDVDPIDRFGRTLAYVYRVSDGLFINAELVRRGFALPISYPPNVAHDDEFVALGRRARTAERGLWSACPRIADRASLLVGEQPHASECLPDYEGPCIPPPPPDLDCGDIDAQSFQVVGDDPHRLDGNHDGVACEPDPRMP